MSARLLTTLCLTALLLPLSGCVGDVALPKTFDLFVEYLESDAESTKIHGLQYTVSIMDPNGTQIFHDEGVIDEGFSRQHQIVFEEVGPYTLKGSFHHDDHGSKSFEQDFDFNILCRNAEHVTVRAVYQAGDLDLQIDGGGPLCRLPDTA